MEEAKVHIVVSGRVQGVFFRAQAQKKARELALGGWAHNMIDGSVELVCEGNKERVGEFIEWCKKGPPMAKIDRCDVTHEKPTGEFSDFAVREFGF